MKSLSGVRVLMKYLGEWHFYLMGGCSSVIYQVFYTLYQKMVKKRYFERSSKIFRKGQGGLLDVEIHPDFSSNKLIYLAYSDPFGRRKVSPQSVEEF